MGTKVRKNNERIQRHKERSIGKVHCMPSFYIPFSIESAKWKPAKRKDHAGAAQSRAQHDTLQRNTVYDHAPPNNVRPKNADPTHRELQHPRPTLRCTPGASRPAEEAGEAQPVPVPVPFHTQAKARTDTLTYALSSPPRVPPPVVTERHTQHSDRRPNK